MNICDKCNKTNADLYLVQSTAGYVFLCDDCYYEYGQQFSNPFAYLCRAIFKAPGPPSLIFKKETK